MKSVKLSCILLSVAVIATVVYGSISLIIGPAAAISDSFDYQTTAQRLVHTGVYEHNNTPTIEVIYGPSARIMPGYTFFLSVFYLFIPLSDNVADNFSLVQPAIIFAQFILTVITAVLMSLCGYYIKGRAGALISGLIAIAYLPFGINIVYTGVENFALFLTVVCLTLFLAALKQRKLQSQIIIACALGLAFGATVLTRPTISLWLIIPVIALALFNKENPRRATVLVSVTILSFLLIMSPWTIRNAVVYREFIPLNTSSSEPLLLSTGDFNFCEAEQAIADEATMRLEDPKRAVALYRIRNAFESDPVNFLVSRAKPVARDVSVHTDMAGTITQVYSLRRVIHDERDIYICIYADRSFPALRPHIFYTSFYSTLTEWSRIIHVTLLFGFMLGVLLSLLRKDLKLLLLASLPIYFTFVHYAILSRARYYYYNVPIYILLSTIAIIFICKIIAAQVKFQNCGDKHEI